MLIPQYERFASKYKYAKLNINVIQTVMEQMNQKAAQAVGNHYMFVVNDALWGQTQTALGDWLKQWGSAPTTVYSANANKGAGGNVKVANATEVGATFVSYIVGGNTVSFTVDRALTKEFPTKGLNFCSPLAS